MGHGASSLSPRTTLTPRQSQRSGGNLSPSECDRMFDRSATLVIGRGYPAPTMWSILFKGLRLSYLKRPNFVTHDA